MKNPELFHKTVGILVKAYQNDTLRHENCFACAVGNLISHCNSIDVTKHESGFINWGAVCFHSYWDILKRNVENEVGRKMIEATGYTTNELNLVERSFESSHRSSDVDGYNGLMAVVDCLMQIHEATTEEAQTAKELFTLTA